MSLWQLGGFKATVGRGYNYDKTLAQTIFDPSSRLRNSDGSVELILGIRKSGASCLLIPGREWGQIPHTGLSQCGPRYNEWDFESLSPIGFSSEVELSDKLASFKIKEKKRQDFDNSQANKFYCNSSQGELMRPTEHCISRIQFENARIFRRLFIDSGFDYRKFGVTRTGWLEQIRICSFVASKWNADMRSFKDRQENPKILDFGFSEADSLTLIVNDKARHFVLKQNQTLGQRNLSKEPFRYGKTEILDEDTIYDKLREFFADVQSQAPMLLLVNDSKLAMTVLSKAGLNTQQWNTGFGNLFYDNRSRNDCSGSSNRRRSRSPLRYPNGPSRRSRSRSPRRHSTTGSAIHVLDIKRMFIALSANEQESKTVGLMREWLGLATDSKTWCAGNEAVLLFDIFRTMAEGEAIDDQRELRVQARQANLQSQIQGPTAGPTAYDDIESDYGGSSDDD